MGFATALSGLNAASNNLAVTGNNIANANTVGFKKSRSEFADVYASSLGGVSSTTPGSGVRVANVAQQFNQGTLQATDNNLDLAINGEGFFMLGKSPLETTDLSYTRDGEFKLNENGFVVNNQGKVLLAYAPNDRNDITAGFSTGVTTPVQINSVTGSPTATTEVELKLNLNADDAPPADATGTPLAFSVTDPNTYNKQTSATIYDSLGSPHILTTYYQKQPIVNAGDPPTWNVYHFIDAQDPADATKTIKAPLDGGTPLTLTFDAVGNLTSPADGKFPLQSYNLTPPTGANPIVVAMNYLGTTQVQQQFGVNGLSQNGKAAGRLTGISIDDAGVIFANFSNGASETFGKVALARFANTNGLSKIGDTTWAESGNSGQPVKGEAGGNGFGAIKSGSLESSNVDLSLQLVNLIVAQQTYQANAQTITTENSIMQTILNIR